MPPKHQPPEDFKEAFRALRLQKELREKAVLDRFYVPRSVRRMELFRQKLLVDKSPSKFLYTGHRKSGKTTELYRLMAHTELGKSYLPVFYSIGDDLEIGDIDYVDILLTNAMKLYETAMDHGCNLDEDVLTDLNTWFEQLNIEVIRETVRTKSKSADFGAKVKLWIAEIGGAIRTNSQSRIQIREKLQPRTSEVIEKSNFIAGQIKLQCEKSPLIIIDDLDKLDPIPALSIFQGHTQALIRGNFKIIYTVPIALAYSPAFQPVSRQFDETIVLPTINSRLRDGSVNPQADALLRNIVLTRLDKSLVQERALDHLIGISNGVLSDLLSVAETCCIRAIAARARQIDWNMVDEELDNLKAQFKRSLSEVWYPRLAQIHQSKDTPKDDMLWEMLNSLAVLEYEPGPWYDIHPAILPLLKEKKLLK